MPRSPTLPKSQLILVAGRDKFNRQVATLRPRQKHRLRKLPTLTQRTTPLKLPGTSQPTFRAGEKWAKWDRQVKVRVRVEVKVLPERTQLWRGAKKPEPKQQRVF